MGDDDAVLFANQAFYNAFAEGDQEAMDEVWADEAAVACIHPGWTPLAGRDEVMESWRSILAQGPPPVECRRARVYRYGDVAFVTCFEVIERDLLVATNVFVREDGRWKMVHHQAGQSADSVPEDEEPRSTLH